MTPLEDVLAGRDERAAWQRRWLEAPEGNYFVCQIGLNIPGYPKRIPRDLAIVRKCRKYLLAHAHAAPAEEQYLENGAGVCWQGAFDASKYEAAALKRCAVEAENSMTAGRVLDIDILTRGGSLSRLQMGLPERRCLLCGDKAKVCARLGRHLPSELREKVIRLVNAAALEM
ncbi:MAG: citrate lyase holo-[acyl-carrier protein] synthase [bacterium]|nr:citrate lyase holo-[acyl-carrier protein] synthase [bacterium]